MDFQDQGTRNVEKEEPMPKNVEQCEDSPTSDITLPYDYIEYLDARKSVSEKLLPEDFTRCTFDNSTEFRQKLNGNSSEEHLIMNDPSLFIDDVTQNATDSFSSASKSSTQFKSFQRTVEPKSSTKRCLNFNDGAPNYDNIYSKTPHNAKSPESNNEVTVSPVYNHTPSPSGWMGKSASNRKRKSQSTSNKENSEGSKKFVTSDRQTPSPHINSSSTSNLKYSSAGTDTSINGKVEQKRKSLLKNQHISSKMTNMKSTNDSKKSRNAGSSKNPHRTSYDNVQQSEPKSSNSVPNFSDYVSDLRKSSVTLTEASQSNTTAIEQSSCTSENQHTQAALQLDVTKVNTKAVITQSPNTSTTKDCEANQITLHSSTPVGKAKGKRKLVEDGQRPSCSSSTLCKTFDINQSTSLTKTSPSKKSSTIKDYGANQKTLHASTPVEEAICRRKLVEDGERLSCSFSVITKISNNKETINSARKNSSTTKDCEVNHKTLESSTPPKEGIGKRILVEDGERPSWSSTIRTSNVKQISSFTKNSPSKKSSTTKDCEANVKTLHSSAPVEDRGKRKLVENGERPSCFSSTIRKIADIKQSPSFTKKSPSEKCCTTKGYRANQKTLYSSTPVEEATCKRRLVEDGERPSCSFSTIRKISNIKEKINSSKKNSSTTKDCETNQKTLDSSTPGKGKGKLVEDGERPSCSSTIRKTSDINQSTTKKSPSKNVQSRKSSTPSTPTKKASSAESPRQRIPGSPLRSPVKIKEYNGLKSKDGKGLQVKHLELLLDLFKTVATSRHLRSLLSPEESYILNRFEKMQGNYQYAVMKLWVWKRNWYNVSKFCKTGQILEDGIYDIFDFLEKEKFVRTDYMVSADMIELLNELDKTKIVEIIDELRMGPTKGSKDNLIQRIVAATYTQTTLGMVSLRERVMQRIHHKLGIAVKLEEEVYNALSNAYLLATFTNPDFDDIHIFFRNLIHYNVVFPEAPIEDYPIFFSRHQFLKYADAVKLRRAVEEIMTNKTSASTTAAAIYRIGVECFECLQRMPTDENRDHVHVNAPHLRKFNADHMYSKVLFTCCEKYLTRKNGDPEQVKEWLEYLIRRFPQSTRIGKFYHKLIWLHMKHLKDINFVTAAELLIEVLDRKSHLLNERDKYELSKLSIKIRTNRKYRLDQIYHDNIAKLVPRQIDCSLFPQQQIDSQCIRSDASGRKRVYYSKSDEEVTIRHVEQVALEYYAEMGYPNGEHCEGSLVKALLMLYFWDIIYNPEKIVPATFVSKLQSAPLDMMTTYFYVNRKEAIDARLEQIYSEWSEEELITFGASNWQKHSHEMSVFGMIMNVIKNDVTVEVLVDVIGRRVLAKIFERLIKDIRQFSSGMPDLFVWNSNERVHKFVEVKGENDRLSTNQILWLNYLQKIGANIEVCWVHSTGSKRKKIDEKHITLEKNNNC